MARAGSGATLANHDWRRQVARAPLLPCWRAATTAPSLLELWRPGRRAFWEESRGQSAEFFNDQSPPLPRPNDCVTADGSRCLLPRSLHRFRPNRDANPPGSPRDESPRPTTSRWRVVARLTYLRLVILRPKATKLSQHLACCLTAQAQPNYCHVAPMRLRTRTISHST